jgi:hypothetical protein
MAWIESQIAGYEAGIATRGRSLDVNAANVAYAHRVEAAGVES